MVVYDRPLEPGQKQDYGALYGTIQMPDEEVRAIHEYGSISAFDPADIEAARGAGILHDLTGKSVAEVLDTKIPPDGSRQVILVDEEKPYDILSCFLARKVGYDNQSLPERIRRFQIHRSTAGLGFYKIEVEQ